MDVRPKKQAAARKMPGGQPTDKPVAQPYRFPAPTKGWVLSENRSMAPPGSARVLDNWIPTSKGIRVRGGSSKYATAHATESVERLFTYKSGGSEMFFAATQSVIADITTVADPDVAPTPVVTGQTSGYYSVQQFGTAGGDFLYAVNGTDDALLFDGATWTPIDGVSTPAITGVTTADLSFVWSYASRLFFIEKDTMDAWYLPVDSIAGAANVFSLAGVFKRGGSLYAGAKWSVDAGDGLDDKCVFLSTEGEVAIYSGTNPGSSTDWSLDGLYQITKPLGPNGMISAGGDLLVATQVGVIPLSEAIKRDVAALELGSVSRSIAPYWQGRAAALTTVPWEMLKIPAADIMVVSQPDPSGASATMLVANLQTGAWGRITGWSGQCIGLFGAYGYFGCDDGCVFRMEDSGSDNGAIYTCVCLYNHDDMGAPIVQKTVPQMRPIFESATPLSPVIGARVDYDDYIGAPPSSVGEFQSGGWDSGLWDEAVWDGATSTAVEARWVAVGETGYTIAPLVQVTYGVTVTPIAELVAVDATYFVGAAVA